MSTLIVVPLGSEMKFLIQSFRDAGREVLQEDHNGVSIYRLRDQNLLLVRGGHGKVQCSLHAQRAVLAFPEVKALMCAGAAGALKPNLRPGDVVIGTATVEHDYHEKFSKEPQPEFPSAEALLARFASRESLTCHRGRIASGDEDILDRGRAEEIAARTGAIAVAWEGAGVARAARLHGIDFMEIRAITDSADANGALHFQTHLRTAMMALAEVLLNGS